MFLSFELVHASISTLFSWPHINLLRSNLFLHTSLSNQSICSTFNAKTILKTCAMSCASPSCKAGVALSILIAVE